MANNVMLSKPEKVLDDKGIKVYRVGTDKFKTISIHIFFHTDLLREGATMNALLPMVLRRGTRRLPAMQSISKYLEELYGANFDCGVNKKGERHLMFYNIEVLDDRYASRKEKLFSEAFRFLAEVLLEPAVVNGAFREEYTVQEKDNLRKLIEGRVNNKRQYSMERCYEEMCRNEKFGIYEYGYVDDLPRTDADTLYEHHNFILKTSPMDIFIVGNMDPEEIKEAFNSSFSAVKEIRMDTAEPAPSDVYKDVAEPRRVFERMDVNQGKLCLGFRTHTAPSDNDYYALLVCNGVLGGGVHSKLFQNVRERAGLAYYAFSRLEKFKGLMLISTGIEVDNYGRVLDIALKQLDDIKAGNISDFEYDSTIKSIETGLKCMPDSHLQIVDFFLSQSISRSDMGFEELIERIKRVTKQEVVDVARKIKLDTIYFLTNKEQSVY